MVVSITAVKRPPLCLANSLNLLSTHTLAAPIPRSGLDCVLNVLRVPNATRLVIYDLSESGETSFTILSISGSRLMMVWEKTTWQLIANTNARKNFLIEPWLSIKVNDSGIKKDKRRMD